MSRTSSGRFSSCRSAAAVAGRLFADRYEMIDLWLPAPVSPCRSCNSAYGIGGDGDGLAAHQLDGESISGSLCICSRPDCPLRRETRYVLVNGSVECAVLMVLRGRINRGVAAFWAVCGERLCCFTVLSCVCSPIAVWKGSKCLPVALLS